MSLLPVATPSQRWWSDVHNAGIAAVWQALLLRPGLDPHRGVVGRRFRLLGQTVFLCLEGGETHYLSPLDLLAYAILGVPQARGLGREGWGRLHAAAHVAGLTLESPDEPDTIDLRAWTCRYTAELSSGPMLAQRAAIWPMPSK